MVRINRNNLDQKLLDQLLQQCAFVIAPKEQQHARLVLDELLGYEEQVTVAKRIACIVLLSEGASSYKISQHVKLSQSTVGAIKSKLQTDNYTQIIKTLKKDTKKYLEILNTLDSLLHLGGILPRYTGPRRTKYSN